MKAVLLLVLSACAGATRSPTATVAAPSPSPHAPAAPAAPAASAPEQRPDCAGERVRVALLGELDRRCWPERNCPRALQVRVSNCTDQALGVSGVIITQAGNEGQLHFEFESDRYRAPAHSQLTFPLGRPERNATWPLTSHTLRIRVTPAIVLRESESTAIFTLRDSAKEEAESGRGNGDDWGMHGGLAPRQGGEAVMPDAGMR